ncbi:MAG: HAD-IA family hydrolase [Clostridiaceae bacterium]|nr:HAD-IA family hydrolase [Clostridiaceae bacterium]
MRIDPEGCKAVFFDLDGTLLDTIPLIVDTYHEVFRACLGHQGDDRDILSGIGEPLDTYLRRVSPDKADQMKAAYLAYNHQRLETHVGIFVGVPQMLEGLAGRGIPLGVVTSKRRDAAARSLEQFGLTPYFRTLITKESTMRHKPHADPLYAAMRELGLDNPLQVAYVGDSLHDHACARAAGCVSILVGWSAMPLNGLKAAGPDIWLEQPSDLPAWFDRGCPLEPVQDGAAAIMAEKPDRMEGI